MPIYTKFGDKGKTSLFGGKTVSKGNLRIEAYGNLDELNSFLGVVLAQTKDKNIKSELLKIQQDLFDIGANLADLRVQQNQVIEQKLKTRVSEFEKQIDLLTKKLPILNNFILPSGRIGSLLHYARTIARRAERRTVILAEKEKVLPEVLVYLNRLSDLLFIFARAINHKEKQRETIWSSKP